MNQQNFKDYYRILGVSKNASIPEIKKAYRQLARKYHPDLNPGNELAEHCLREINEAQEVLTDVEKRQKYDLYGENWQQNSHKSAPTQGGVEFASDSKTFNFAQNGNLGSLFHNVLNRIGITQGHKTFEDQTFFYNGLKESLGGLNDLQPGDSKGYITLTFSEAFYGTKQQIRINQEIVQVWIPAGAKPGSCLKIQEKGEVDSLLKKRGDFYLIIELQPHPLFEFEGNNLVAQIPITPEESVLGAEIEVPTPDGQVTVQVPPRVNSGHCIRIREQGWYRANQKRGDLIIKLQIVTPDYINDIEEEYYRKIQQVSNFKPRNSLKYMKL